MRERRAPVLIAVDDDADGLSRTEAALLSRYGGDYRVISESSCAAALTALERLREAGDDVALVLAGQMGGEQTGSDFLGQVRSLHPHAKRALLIEWGAWANPEIARAILHAMATGRIDYYVLRPWRRRDEQFHRVVSEFLHEWAREHSPDGYELILVGPPGTARVHELHDMLRRSGVPHGFHPAGSPEARELLDGDSAAAAAEVPVVRMHDGRVLVDPSSAELAGAFGVDTELPAQTDYDVAVVGAGPAGLSTAVYCASEGLSTLVVERESIGGQAGSSSLIRNYLGFSRGVGGGELAQRAYQQAWVFGVRFLLMREVVGLELGPDRHTIEVAGAGSVTARAVVLASGVSYRRLGIPALEELVGAGVFYGASTGETAGFSGEEVFVVGGANSAGQAALHLARTARRVTLLVRGESLAAGMSQYLRETIAAAGNIVVRLQTEIVDGGGTGRLEWLELRSGPERRRERVPASAAFIMIGARPHTEWLPQEIARDEAGYVYTGDDIPPDRLAAQWPLARRPLGFEASVPSVFAIGDVRHGSLKRVAAAVGEGSVATREIHDCLSASRSAAVRHGGASDSAA